MPVTKEFIDQAIEEGLTKSTIKFMDGKPCLCGFVPGVSQWVLLNANLDISDECLYWSNVIERLYIPRNEMIPIHCQNCYKVVVRPESLDDAMKLFKAMSLSDLYGKVGAETRDSVPANWGAYFYNQGLEAGQECKKKVRALVDEALSPEHEVFLKRGCTENELPPTGMGDSLYWEPFEGQEEIEEYIKSSVVTYVYGDPFPGSYHLKKTMQMWVAFARSRGDKTWKKYNNGEAFPEYRRY